MNLRITIFKYHLWYSYQISLQIMLLPILMQECIYNRRPALDSVSFSASSSRWSALTVWPQGVLVRHGKLLYKALGIHNVAIPGDSHHGRFFVSNPAEQHMKSRPMDKTCHFSIFDLGWGGGGSKFSALWDYCRGRVQTHFPAQLCNSQWKRR